jgi:hypothetical protein
MRGKSEGRVIKAPKFHGSMSLDETVQLSTGIRRDTDAMIEKLIERWGGNRRSVVEKAVRDAYFVVYKEPITEEEIEKFSTRNKR